MERLMTNDICKKCGACCNWKEGPTVSLNEINKLPNPKYERIGEGLFRLTNTNSKCQYLDEDGCTLGELKPLACKIFPFHPIKQGWTVKTYCPYWNEFDDNDLESAKADFKENRQEYISEIL